MSRKGYVPPYTINDNIVNLISYNTELITKITINDTMGSNPKLRRENRIRTIHASLAIENNSLSLDQMTDIMLLIHKLLMDGLTREWEECGKRYYYINGKHCLVGFLLKH